jgi:hypothetical protein
LDKIDPDIHFYYYDRIALAEAVMSAGDKEKIIGSYLEFRKQYEDPNSNLKSLLSPAKEYIIKIKSAELQLIMKKIYEITINIHDQTGITIGIGIKNPTN